MDPEDVPDHEADERHRLIREFYRVWWHTEDDDARGIRRLGEPGTG
jgi:hypothetical protein